MAVDNKSVYESGELARRYGLEAQLQPPEETILALVRESLIGGRMLDVGVGGGRTTLHFAPLVKEYVGIDYAESMIAACRERFKEAGDGVRFQVSDARSMPMFADGSFDFVLFSYNGLDYVSHGDRATALREIRRVLRRGGYVALSTHNMNSLRKRLRVTVSLNPRTMASRIFWIGRFVMHNGGLFPGGMNEYCEVYDGALGYRLRTHYVTPEGAVEELERAGFHDPRIFSLAGGQVVAREQAREIADDWLYYLATG